MENKFERVEFVVPPELSGLRIDKVIATIPLIATRSQAARLIQAGRVRIEGRILKASYEAQAGDRIDIDIPIVPTSVLEPYDFPLDIPYEDSDLIVVNKPAGLVVHPACGHLQDTLVNALLHHTKDLSMGFNEQRPGLVHRIDKGTSGLLVIAKNEQAQRFLALQFQRKTTHRLYRALTFGRLPKEQGTIQSYLKRHPDDRKRVASTPMKTDGTCEGKLAITHYAVKAFHPSGISLIELRLETGRTHQIRVHLSESGHPIVGDVTYGASKRLKSLKSVQLRKMIEEMPRFALHAAELGFVHPTTKKQMIFRAPWPQDLLGLVDHCQFSHFNEQYEVHIEDAASAAFNVDTSSPITEDFEEEIQE